MALKPGEANHGRAAKRAEKLKDPKYATRKAELTPSQAATYAAKTAVQVSGVAAPTRQSAFMDLAGFSGAYLDVATAEGYLKICPAERENSCFYYYKFNRGRWAGHYVVAVADRSDPDYALWILGGKIDEVLSGTKKPIKDTYQG